jgi:hypothetical protein
MLKARATAKVWWLLLGITIGEGTLLGLTFRAKGDWLSAVWHYVLTPPGRLPAWILAAAVTAMYALASASHSPVIRAHALQPWSWRPYVGACLLAIPMALISGIFEEAFFRRALMDGMMHRGSGPVMQVAISALSFGAVHAIWGVGARNLRAAAAAMIVTGSLGAALAVTYLIGDRSLAPCTASHIAINLALEPWLIITAVTGSWKGVALDSPQAGGEWPPR